MSYIPPPPGFNNNNNNNNAYPAVSVHQTPGFSVGVELQQQKFDHYAANRGRPPMPPHFQQQQQQQQQQMYGGNNELSLYGAQGYLTNSEQQRWETGSMTSEFKKAGCNCENCRKKKENRRKSRRRHKKRSSWFGCCCS
jgi:hypothetical protein